MENVVTLTQDDLAKILVAVFAENGFAVQRIEYVVPGAAEGTVVGVRVISSFDGLRVFRAPREDDLRRILTGGIDTLKKDAASGSAEPEQPGGG